MVLCPNRFGLRFPSGPRRSAGIIAILMLVMLGGFLGEPVSCKETWGLRESECLTKNPIIRMLHEKKVTVFSNPKQSGAASNTCSWEWDEHRTCCGAASLRAYAINDVHKLQKAVDRVSSKMQKLFRGLKNKSKRIQTSFERARRKESSIRARIEKQAAGTDSIALAKAVERIRKFEAASQDMETFSKLVDHKFSEHKFSSFSRQECFERIKQIRTSSLCASCSGDSARFFLQGRALISLEDCKITIGKCGLIWAKSIEMIDAIVMAQKITKYLKSLYPEEELPIFFKRDTNMVKKWMGSTHLKQHLTECGPNVTECPQTSAKFLCEAFISVEEREFFEDTEQVFSKTYESLDSSNPQSHPASAGRQGTESGPSGRQLMLQLAVGTNTGSVMVSRDPPEGHQNMPIQDTFP